MKTSPQPDSWKIVDGKGSPGVGGGKGGTKDGPKGTKGASMFDGMQGGTLFA